jgi:hypothetical protein
MELMRYGEEWLPSETPTTNRLLHKDCGKITRAGQICSECGGPITLKNVELVEVCTAASSQIPAVDTAFAVERQMSDA